MEWREAEGSVLDIKFEMPFRHPHGEIKQVVGYEVWCSEEKLGLSI